MSWQVLLTSSRRIGSAVATALAVAVAALLLAAVVATSAVADSPRQPAEPASDAPSTSTHCSAKPQLQPQPASTGAPVTFTEPVVAAGGRTQARATGFTAKEKVQVVLYGTGGVPKTVIADRKGRIRVDLTVPETALAGWHSVQITGWCTNRVAVGRLLVGRIGAGTWPGTAYPSWVGWAALAAGLVVLASVGWLAVQLWQRHGQEES